MIFTVSVAGTIAALGAGFAEYMGKLFPALSAGHISVVVRFPGISGGHLVNDLYTLNITREHLVSLAAIALLTAVNIVGLRKGAVLQNIAIWAKFAAIAALVILGFALGKGSWGHYSLALPASPATPSLMVGIGGALVAVFWAYDGWVYITWVAGEVKDPQRNLPRSLILGLLIVGVLYLAINAVYLYALPLTDIAANTAVAQVAAVSMFSAGVARWLSLMIAVSCFGAMATAIMCGARVYYAMAEDGVFFRALAKVNPRWHTPARSLVLQGVWAAVLALSGGYTALFTYVMFMMVLSYALTVAALFVLRRKMPNAPRPYRCAGYPWFPALYVLIGIAWTVDVIIENRTEALWGIVIVAVGIPFYIYWKWSNRPAKPTAGTTSAAESSSAMPTGKNS